MANLKILSFGAGAIGTYIGGSLASAGEQIVFVEQAIGRGRIASARLATESDNR